MLEGKRRLRECYLDDYVKNVRAKAKMSLEKPEGATLSRILSIDSDPALSQAEGVYVRFFEGWEEEDLRGQEQVCLISSGHVHRWRIYYRCCRYGRIRTIANHRDCRKRPEQ